MAKRHIFSWAYDVLPYRHDRGVMEDDLRQRARQAATEDGTAPPPADVEVEASFRQWVDGQTPGLVPCDEADADVVTLTATWEA